MSQLSGPRLRTLLRQADKAAEYGKLQAAAELYTQILEEGGDVPEAMVGLAGVIQDASERETLYTQALALQPDNEIAQYELAVLRGENPTPPPSLLAKEEETVAEESEPDVVTEETLYCYRHPNRETALRCYSCERPICIDCTNKTPVGYICPECKRNAEDKFYEATTRDYILAGSFLSITNLVLGFLIVLVIGDIGFIYFSIIGGILGGGAIGRLLGNITLRLTGKRRGRYIPIMGAGFMIFGILLPALFYLLLGVFPPLFLPGAYLFAGVSAIVLQLR